MIQRFADRSEYTRRAPWWLLAAVVIAWATLTPQFGPPRRPFVWCLTCGPNWLSDVIANIALFAPLGAGLVFSRLRLSTAIVVGVCASIAIELLQRVGVASGRTPALADIVANSIGTIIGAWTTAGSGAIARQLVGASAPRSRTLLVVWTVALSVMLAATAWAVAPAVRSPVPGPGPGSGPVPGSIGASGDAVKASWMSTVPESPFVQSRLRGVVNGVQLRAKSAGQIIAAVAPTDSLHITLSRQVIDEKDRRDKPITLVYVHGSATMTEQAALMQFADDLILRGAVNASRIGLQTPALRVRGVFALDSVLMWKFTRIEALVAPGRLSVIVETPDSRIGTVSDNLALTPALGWTLVQPIVGATARVAPLLTVLWLGFWFVPVGFWLARAMPARAIATRIIAAALWSAVPLLVAQVSVSGVGIAPLALWQAVAAVVGAITGALLATKLAPVADDRFQLTARS